ncbi:hypothetical protein [Amycolatopsis sp. lyj-108]|uniref:hypothetical protein n=1 Tax=Amycolatopsis sp. lyj-108 TaxID=2789286 RepID=UPI00397BCC21
MSTDGVVEASASLTLPQFCFHVENAFLADRPGISDLREAALASQASPAVFAALDHLPNRRFESLMDVLAELPGLSFDGGTE